MPERREIGLEDLRGLRRLLELLQDVDLDRPLHRRALGHRLLIELLGLLQIVIVARGVLRKSPDRVRQRRRVALRVAFQDLVDEAVIVEGVRKAFAGIDVVERRLGVVHAD